MQGYQVPTAPIPGGEWGKQIEAWGLDIPDTVRQARAAALVSSVFAVPNVEGHWTVSGKIEVELTPNGVGCDCKDFTERQKAAGEACKHIAAVAMMLDATGSAPQAASAATAPVAQQPSTTPTQHVPPPVGAKAKPVVNPNAWPEARIRAAVAAAIGSLSLDIEKLATRYRSVFVSGTTGTGKTSAVQMLVARQGSRMEEVAGSDSWLEFDLVGNWGANRVWAPGPLGRGFDLALAGQQVVLFIDEAPRMNPRALDLLMRAVQPISADIARLMGMAVPLDVTSVYALEAPMMGHRQWAPAANITWILAGNPWNNPLDQALVRRFHPVEAVLDEKVADATPTRVAPMVKALWKSYVDGTLPMPLEYQALAEAEDANDLFRTYLKRIRLLNPIAAESTKSILKASQFDV